MRLRLCGLAALALLRLCMVSLASFPLLSLPRTTRKPAEKLPDILGRLVGWGFMLVVALLGSSAAALSLQACREDWQRNPKGLQLLQVSHGLPQTHCHLAAVTPLPQ